MREPSSDPNRPSLSVVVPVRDEERTLAELHRRLRQALSADTEILFVDDGSKDGSLAEIRRIVREDPLAVAIRFRRSFGKSWALAAGFRRCRGRKICTIDADLQEDPEAIVTLAERVCLDDAAGGDADHASPCFDLVSGWRRTRRDSPLKVLGSRLFNAFVCLLSGLRLRDINCGLKVMRREVAEQIPMDGGFHRFLPLLAHWKGFRVGEVEVEHQSRRHGRSRYGAERVFHGLIDFLVLLFLERFETRPSRLFVGLGVLFSVAGIGILSFIAYLRLSPPDFTIESRYPLLALGALLMVVGTQLIFMGLLAELVAHGRRGARIEEPASEEILSEPSPEGSEGGRAEERTEGGPSRPGQGRRADSEIAGTAASQRAAEKT